MPNTLPKISVVTPSFNQGRFIRETIESVLAQDYPDFEHLIMDGGSTDETVSILKEYPHLTWVSEPDRGQTHAINKGMRRAKGGILCYLNSDDQFTPGTFKRIAELISPQDGRHVVVGATRYIDEDGKEIEIVKPRLMSQLELLCWWQLGHGNKIPQPSTFWHRSVTEKIGLFDEKLQWSMDYEYWVRMVVHGYHLHLYDEIWSIDRLHGQCKRMQLATKGRERGLAEHRQIGKRWWPPITDRRRWKLAKIRHRWRYRRTIADAHEAMIARHKATAWVKLLKGLALWPGGIFSKKVRWLLREMIKNC